MLSALFTSVADALISYAIDKLDPAERIKSWLRLDPARLAFKKALARAYSAFARQYPEYTSSLFDQSFLSTDALPELSKLLTRNQHPDPALLAQAWGRSLGASTDFAQAATKPAAYFIERFEAELKAEPALQSIFDSRALEDLPKLEAEIQKLSAELQRGLNEALKVAQNYQQATIHIGGDVKGDGIIIGHNNSLTVNKYDYSTNYYYTGDFIALNEYYIPLDGVFQRVRVDDFIGRDWLTTKVDAFLNDQNRKSGAFLLIGDAGVGKTSFMAHLVKERRYLHLFAEQAPGQAMLQRAMQSLGSQLVTRYQIDPYKDRDTLNALSVFPDFLERILRLAASTLTEGEKIVIVCDALDEAGVFPDHFVFGLPKELPDGVYFILSQRPVNVKLPNFEPVIEKLEAQGEGNLQDIQDYLSAVAKRPKVAGQIRSNEYSEEFFIQTLKEKSQGVWMYLHYIIKEIESGARAPLDLANLPTGLVGYYAEYWDAWRTGKRGKGEEAWDELYAPLLTTLAAAQEAIPVDLLIQWANVTVTPREVTRLLTEHWRAFITEKEKDGQKTFAPYHLSFKDFITGRVDIDKLPPAQANLVKDLATQTVDTHKRIVGTFEKECNGEWEKLVVQDYPRLHLTAHLNGAGEYEKLRIMLTEGNEKIKWAEAREKIEEAYTGYLNDLIYIWDYAEREQNYALAIRCMLIENSIHSLAANISPELLAELGKAGLWSYTRCLAIIQQRPNKASSLYKIAPHLPSFLLQSALAIAGEIKDEFECAKSLGALAPFLPKELKSQAVLIAHKIQHEAIRAQALIDLAPYLPNNLRMQVIQEVLFIAHQINKSADRAEILVKIAYYLPVNLKSKISQEALSVIHDIEDRESRARTLAKLEAYFPINFKSKVTKEARELAREIKIHSDLYTLVRYLSDNSKALVFSSLPEIEGEGQRANALVNLAPYLSDNLKSLALSFARGIKNKSDYARAMVGIAPHLSKDLKSQVIQEVWSTVSEIEDEGQLANTLVKLAPYLSDDLKSQALSFARGIKNKLDYARAMVGLALHLSNNLRSQVIQEVCSIAPETINKASVASLLPYPPSELPDNLRSQFIQKELILAREIKDVPSRAQALTTFSLYIHDDLKSKIIQEVLASIREIEKLDRRAETLIVIAPHLPDNHKSQVIQDILSMASESKDQISNFTILVRLAPYIPHEMISLSLSLANEIEIVFIRIVTLSILAPYLPDNLKSKTIKEALSLAHGIEDDVSRVQALTKLVPNLFDNTRTQVVQEVLSVIREIPDEISRTSALTNLMPYLPVEFKLQIAQEVMSAVRKIKKVTYRAEILAKLANYPPDNLRSIILQEALSATYEIEDEYLRHNVLIALLPHFTHFNKIIAFREILFSNITTDDLDALLMQWKEIKFEGMKINIMPFIKFISKKNRKDGTVIISALTPALVHFSGPEIVPELYRSIQDTARWWP